ncbi:MAG: hypothetical protein EA369_07715 [Bradymonadales bacterium]|nr:MAG: hypothetical protein EA369_07715 [Bradymonadales bacterium]
MAILSLGSLRPPRFLFRFVAFCLLSPCFLQPLLGDDDAVSSKPSLSYERLLELSQEIEEAEVRDEFLDILNDRGRFLETDFQRHRDLHPLEDPYIRRMTDFLYGVDIFDLPKELLKALHQDLSRAFPAGQDLKHRRAPELESELQNSSYFEFAKTISVISSLHLIISGEAKALMEVTNPRWSIRPESMHRSLSEALRELPDFDLEGQDSEYWEQQLISGFLEMLQQGRRVEKQLYDEVFRSLEKSYEATRTRVSQSSLVDESLEGVNDRFRSLIRLESDEIRLEFAWGRAEITQADGVKVIKLVHYASERAFLFVNTNKVRPDSKHLRKILARAMVEGGRGRLDGETGRDPVVIFYENGTEVGYTRTSAVQTYKRPPKKSMDYAKLWWWATMHKPNGKIVVEQAICAIFQMGVILGVGYLDLEVVGNSTRTWEDVWTATFFTGFYGAFVIGFFIDSWIHWESRAKGQSFDERRKTIKWKKYVKSLLYAIPFTALFTQRSLLDPENTARVLVNTELNAMVKSRTHVANELAEKAGVSSREIKIPVLNSLPFVGQYFSFKWGRLVYNFGEIYLTLPLKILAYVNFGVWVNLGDQSAHLPLGQAAILLAIPIATFEASRISAHFNLRKKEDYQESWNRLKSRLYEFFNFFYANAEDLVMLIPDTLTRTAGLSNSEKLSRFDRLIRRLGKLGLTSIQNIEGFERSLGNKSKERLKISEEKLERRRNELQARESFDVYQQNSGLDELSDLKYGVASLNHGLQRFSRSWGLGLQYARVATERSLAKLANIRERRTPSWAKVSTEDLQPSLNAVRTLGYGIGGSYLGLRWVLIQGGRLVWKLGITTKAACQTVVSSLGQPMKPEIHHPPF